MQVNAYLNFNGQCAEAFRFYEQVLGGKIEAMMTHGETPMVDQVGPEWRDAIIHARLVVGDQVLMGSDAPPDNWDVAPDVWPAVRSDLDAHPPALIVDTSPADWSDFARYPMRDYPTLADFVAGGYHQAAVVDGVVIYARNGG